MPRDDSLYLKHIRDAIIKIEAYTKKVNQKIFHNDTLVQDAVIRQIEIIGEATKRLSSKVRANNSEIPWDDIAGMRDKLIHDYFGVNADEVWLTVQRDIPALKKQVSRILKGL